jgi:restriction system protein
MSIPDYQTIMLPLMKTLADGNEISIKNVVENISSLFKLSETEKSELLPSGTSQIINNRVGWARTYLKKAGLLEDPKRGFVKISERGKEFLKTAPQELNISILRQFTEFQEFRELRHEKKSKEIDLEKEIEQSNFPTPQEALEYGFEKINESLADDLIKTLKDCSPSFFEKVVVELIVKMGYGGSRQEAGQVIGKSGDEGIDGIIKEDKLGLDTIYIQAKRWENVVSRPEIQKFVGALAGQRAKKGIFITTSRFSNEAQEYSTSIDAKLVLIDGNKLAQLMIENNVGVSTVNIVEIKRIDTDYFIEG